jgi:hypothetical protein
MFEGKGIRMTAFLSKMSPLQLIAAFEAFSGRRELLHKSLAVVVEPWAP